MQQCFVQDEIESDFLIFLELVAYEVIFNYLKFCYPLNDLLEPVNDFISLK